MKTMQETMMLFLFFIFTVHVFGQTSLSLFNAELTHKKLNPSLWHVADQQREAHKGLLLYEHNGIKVSAANIIKPVISIIYETLENNISEGEYAEGWHHKMQAVLDKKVSRKDIGCVIYYYHYDKEERHTLVVAYFVCPGNGIQIMADAPKNVYPKVEPDIQSFIESIKLQPNHKRK
jgi:hypothetical protein